MIKYRESMISEHLHRRASKLRIPLSGTFELTPVCNMNCKMCYVRKSPKEQEAIGPLHSADEWIALAKEARDAGMVYVLLTGGEPFVYPEFEKVLAAMHQMGLVIAINTNGTLIDDEKIEFLKKYPPSRINITLYGASNDTYGKLCGNPRGFDQVRTAIQKLKEAGLSVFLNVTVTPYNKDDLQGILDFSDEYQVPPKTTTYMFPPVRKNQNQFGKNDRLDPDMASYYRARLDCLMQGEEKYLETVLHSDRIIIPQETVEECLEEPDQASDSGILCRAGKCTFWVDWQGGMTICGMIPAGKEDLNAFQSSFAECWQRVKDVSDGIRVPAKCTGCELLGQCMPCAAICYTETGNFEKVPEYRCRMSHSYPTMAKKLAMEILEKNGTEISSEEREC